jgi:hypothetical protein
MSSHPGRRASKRRLQLKPLGMVFYLQRLKRRHFHPAGVMDDSQELTEASARGLQIKNRVQTGECSGCIPNAGSPAFRKKRIKPLVVVRSRAKHFFKGGDSLHGFVNAHHTQRLHPFLNSLCFYYRSGRTFDHQLADRFRDR